MFCTTLFFFNINESYSKTTMISPSACCTTTHYDSSGTPVGTSETVMNTLAGPCRTIHKNSDGEQIGLSETIMHRLYGPYKTTYYNNQREVIGTSQTTMSSAYSPCKTDYYNNKEEKVYSSHTNRSSMMGPYKTEFSSVSCLDLKIPKISNTRAIQSKKPAPFNKGLFVSQMKKYYLSQSFFFNSSSKIFDGKTMEEVIETLKERACNNPGGASQKTVNHYNLNGDWLKLTY